MPLIFKDILLSHFCSLSIASIHFQYLLLPELKVTEVLPSFILQNKGRLPHCSMPWPLQASGLQAVVNQNENRFSKKSMVEFELQ